MAIPLERARELVLSAPSLRPQAVAIDDAAGLVLAGEVRVRADSPREANSAMDGYAVTAGPAGRTLRLVGESRAGSPSTAAVEPATAIRIATGGVLPPGAGAVVPLERASVAGELVTVHESSAPGRNVRPAGEDMRVGQIVLSDGARLGAVELAVAIGAGHGELVCRRRPRVALLGTGDELREPGSRLANGEIHDSNTIALASLAGDAAATVVSRARSRDDPAAIRRALDRAFEEADLVILSGGVSVGPHDHVRAALAGLGAEELFSGVEIRPGRPTWFGRRGEKFALGLPGNPVAAIVAFILLGRPLLAALEGTRYVKDRERALLSSHVAVPRGRTDIVGVRLRTLEGQGLTALPTRRLGSHLTTALLGVDGLALIPPDRGDLPAGSAVDVERLWR